MGPKHIVTLFANLQVLVFLRLMCLPHDHRKATAYLDIYAELKEQNSTNHINHLSTLYHYIIAYLVEYVSYGTPKESNTKILRMKRL